MSITRRKLLGITGFLGSVGAILTAAWQYREDGNEDGYPLTIDDFDGGTIREAWGNADNHDTTDAYAHSGSHAAYRVDGSSLYDDGTGFVDAFQEGGRFLSWTIYVDENDPDQQTTIRLGFNAAEEPGVADEHDELQIDFDASELRYRNRVAGTNHTVAMTGAELATQAWFEVVAWWGDDAITCDIFDGSGTEIASLRADDQLRNGDYWWLFDEQSGDGSLFDTVRFHEEHPYHGRHYTDPLENSNAFVEREVDVVISPDGSDADGDGSYENPYYSPQAAFSNLQERDYPRGSRIICRGGTYELDSIQRVRMARGSSNGPIIMREYADEDPEFDFSPSEEIEHGFDFVHADHWVLRGFEVHDVNHPASSEGMGIRVQLSRNVLIEDVEVHHNTMTGLYMNGTTDTTVRQSSFHHNSDEQNGNADGISISDACSNILVERCKTYRNFDDGIDLYSADPGNTIRYCSAWGNGYDLNGNPLDGWNAGYKMGGDENSGGNYIHHCIAYDNQRGFSTNRAPRGTVHHNCVAFDSEVINFHLDVQAMESNGETHEIRNCISHDGNGHSPEAGVDSAHNTWDLDIDDPQFRSTDSADDAFLYLQEGSPCIDSGTDVGFAYEGDAPDLGAFEFGAEWSLWGD